MLSWLQRMGAVEPYLALARAVSMLFTAIKRVGPIHSNIWGILGFNGRGKGGK